MKAGFRHALWLLALMPAMLGAAWTWHTGNQPPAPTPLVLSPASASFALRSHARLYGVEERQFPSIAAAPKYQTTLHFRTYRPTSMPQMCFVILGDSPYYLTNTSLTIQGRAWPWVFLLLATPVGIAFVLRRPLGRVLSSCMRA